MTTPETRYCPHCHHPVTAPADRFQKPARCPKCSQVNLFLLPREPLEPLLPKPPLSLNEYIHRALLLGCCFLAVITLALLTSSKNNVLVIFLSMSSLVSSILLFLFTSHSIEAVKRSQSLKTEHDNLRLNYQRALATNRLHEKKFDDILEQDRVKLRKAYDDLKDEANEKIRLYNQREATISSLGKKLLDETVKFVAAKLTPNNYPTRSKDLSKTIDFCRKHEFTIPSKEEKRLLNDLNEEFKRVVARDIEKQEQARIKAQIREEQRAEREIQRELERIENEKRAIQRALEEALKYHDAAHQAEVDILTQKLQEAELKSQRTISMAQLTKSGHVYVISNLGCFGERVFKIGMTRRLEPIDRICELGDASVPFPFDVHMMISCDNAPALENALHKALHLKRMNRINLRKEFFRCSIEDIARIVKQHHGDIEYTANHEALEYFQSLEMTDEEFARLTNNQPPIPVFDEEEEEACEPTLS
ncbi:GIY-YIG nuclease family protein [Lacunimicrobium album]